MLVFLYMSTRCNTYESPYYIIGSFTTILDVSYDENGNRYYADRYGILGRSIDITSNYAHDVDVSAEVVATAATKDPIVSEIGYTYPYIFSEADLVAQMENEQTT